MRLAAALAVATAVLCGTVTAVLAAAGTDPTKLPVGDGRYTAGAPKRG